MAGYRLDLFARAGVVITAGLPFTRLVARWVLNAPGSIEADFNLYDDFGATQPAPGVHELVVQRDGGGGFVPSWGGYLWDDDVDIDERTVKLLGEGYLSRLRRRRVRDDLHYVTVNQQQIVWNLIAHTQGLSNGDLGVTQGAHIGANVQRTRHYCAAERPNIGFEIERFADLDDGLDLEIDALRALNTWGPQRKTVTAIALDGTKVNRVKYSRDARDVVTDMTGIGEDDCEPILVDVQAAAQAVLYGRLDDSIDVRGDDVGEITAEAREELRARKRAERRFRVIFREGATGTPAWGTWELGCLMTYQDDRGYATFGPVDVRLVEWALILEPPAHPYIEFTLDSAVD